MDYQAKLKTPFGVLGISCTADALTGIDFLAPDARPMPPQQSFGACGVRTTHSLFRRSRFSFRPSVATRRHGASEQGMAGDVRHPARQDAQLW